MQTAQNSRQGQPQKERSKLVTVCPYILGTEFGERLAFYGFSTNLVNYLKRLGASSSSAASYVSAFSGFCYLTPLLGGWLADSHLGRYKTIFIFSVIYVIGLLILAGSAAIPGILVEDGRKATTAQALLLIGCLSLIATGTGGVKANVSSFGADQFDETKEQERREKQSYFNWFYMFVNLGSLLASTLLVYIQDQGMWGIGFGIPGVALVIAVSLFLFGKPMYKMLPASESPLARFVEVTRAALRNRRENKRHTISGRAAESGDDASAPLVGRASEKKEHWLDWAIRDDDFTEHQVYEIKLVYGVFPVFYTSIFYWVMYMQMSGLFILQGQQLEREVDLINDRIPSATMSTFDVVAVILFIPLYEFGVLPQLKRLFNYAPTMLQRIGAGYVVAFLAMVAAYTIERARLKRFDEGEVYSIEEDDDTVWVVRVSIWWQIIPYALIGLSEVLASIGVLEFFYNEAPDTMRSMMSALSLIAVGFGGYVSSLLLYVVNEITEANGGKWISDNLNEGHLDYFFILLAAIILASFFWFLYVSSRYEYKQISHGTSHGTINERQQIEDMGRSVAYDGSVPDHGATR